MTSFENSCRIDEAMIAGLPEVQALRGVPQPAEHHPEVDTFVHVMMALDQARKLTSDWTVHLAVLLHDLGKGLTPHAKWPHHAGHEEDGVPLVVAVCERIGVDVATTNLCLAVCRYHTHCHRIASMSTAGIRRFLRSIRALEDPELFARFLLSCEADARGRLGLEEREYVQPDLMREHVREFAEWSRREAVRLRIKGAVNESLVRRHELTPEQHRAIREKTAELVELVCQT